jgi:hypothetical protein
VRTSFVVSVVGGGGGWGDASAYNFFKWHTREAEIAPACMGERSGSCVACQVGRDCGVGGGGGGGVRPTISLNSIGVQRREEHLWRPRVLYRKRTTEEESERFLWFFCVGE